MPEEIKAMVTDMVKAADGNREAQALLKGIKLGLEYGKPQQHKHLGNEED